MVVLDAVLCGMRLGIADFHWLELGAASLLIGIRYGIGFACWIVFCGGWSGLSLLKAGAGALLVAGGAYGAIDLLGMADAPLVPFAFGCLTVASLVLLSRYWSDAGARREVVTRGFAEAKLPSLVLVALLALAMQMVTVTLPQLSEWGISTVVAGAMLFVLVALKAKVVADDVAAYFFIVGLVSALIGVILVLDWSHSRIAQIASMTIFWLLFMLLFVVFCNKNGTLAGFSSLRLSLLYVVVMYSSLTAGPFSQFDGCGQWPRCGLALGYLLVAHCHSYGSSSQGAKDGDVGLFGHRGVCSGVSSRREGGRGAGLSDQRLYAECYCRRAVSFPEHD